MMASPDTPIQALVKLAASGSVHAIPLLTYAIGSPLCNKIKLSFWCFQAVSLI